MSEVQQAKDYWKANHFQSARVPPRDEQPHRYEVAEHIAALNPASILEFGCSSGRNLRILRDYLPTASLVGVDANAVTIQAGRDAHSGITLIEGDESYLPHFADGAFDVVFTVSVLDHIPHPEWKAVYAELVRIAKRAMVMLEPVYPGYGYASTAADNDLQGHTRLIVPSYGEPLTDAHVQTSVEANCADLGIPAAPFSFVHDYLGIDPFLRIVRPLPIPAPQWERFGSLYTLMQRDIRMVVCYYNVLDPETANLAWRKARLVRIRMARNMDDVDAERRAKAWQAPAAIFTGEAFPTAREETVHGRRGMLVTREEYKQAVERLAVGDYDDK